MKTFAEYQEFTKSKARYNTEIVVVTSPFEEAHMPYTYPVLAIAEEAGEVCGKIAKFVRKSAEGVDLATLQKLSDDVGKELGDLLYQVSETARQFGFGLEDIAAMNVDKLTDRDNRGVLVGEGDNR